MNAFNDTVNLWSEVAGALPRELREEVVVADSSPEPPIRARRRRGGPEPKAAPPATVPIGLRRKRGFEPSEALGQASVQLVQDGEGLLRWQYTPTVLARAVGRRSYRSLSQHPRDVVAKFSFEDFGFNRVTEKLIGLDQTLSGDRGMRIWRNKRFAPQAQPEVKTGRVLLLIHGTFSSCEMWEKELPATEQGDELLKQWASRYSAVLGFNHHTLSVGAWANAIELNRALQKVTVPIDVVCHSRGGLVLSWLLRLAPVRVERVVFVGSPLVGTSLAAPDKLRGALDLFANYADAGARLGPSAGNFLPLAVGAAGLAKILGKALRLGSGLPVIDAAVSLVPGLATQQATGNNLEIQLLFADRWLTEPQMSGVGVSFMPRESAEPLWKVWKRFSNVGDQIKYGLADLVFPGANDLVVDTAHMYQLGSQGSIPFRNLGPSATTHHTNYFRDGAVLDELAMKLA